ncbi:MAG TPA: ABC transporter ATP-binding protein [Candidatus Sulfotelmatobacter sp.]|jgi:ABC-type polysaccharide/polyol phosphate transport system ATPase subunit|nr:ABC transporter ATP-binding protein [Candidatus Sulfotelmatobacter sp.]
MSEIAIRAEGLSKRYRIGLRERYSTLRDVLARSLRAPWTLFRGAKNETFWALKDVSLEVHEAEVLGLIGRNGAGKTTLLKILSRITRPTAGWAEIHGRVGSLLEVGTGFHPELTGRENTFLSGAILGMGKAEIARKFDEIVAFAEVEKFIDTPVKHYSSGMFVRLAFAVAAHLESEILLVDEVLAVGDINFQKKCLGKMGDVARAGRTVVLVSHQLNQIRRLCDRVVWIDAGGVRQNGATHEVVSAYESAMLRGDRNGSEADRNVSVRGRFIRWRIVVPDCQDAQTLSTLGPVEVRFSVQIQRPVELGHHGVALFNSEGQLIWGNAQDSMRLEACDYEFSYTFPYLPLRPGSYSWRVSLYDAGELVDAWDCLPQMLVATEPLAHPRDEWAGLLNLPSDFCVLSEVERPS